MDQELRETQNFHWWIFAEDKGLKPIFSNVVGCKFSDKFSIDVKLRCGMNFGSNVVFTQNPNFINPGLAYVNTTDKLGSISVPATRDRRPTSSCNWIRHVHNIKGATVDRVSETRSNIDYIKKSDFETMREIQDFERENISMSQQKTPDTTPLTRPTESPEHFTISPEKNVKAHEPMLYHFTISPEQNRKEQIPDDPDPEPSLSDLSPEKKNAIRR